MNKNQNDNNQEKFQNEKDSKANNSFETTSIGFIKGIKLYNVTQGYKYAVKFLKRGVNVIDKTVGSAVFRLDSPHKGVNYNHININPKISGMRDPHLKLPAGGLTVGKGIAKACTSMTRVINKIAIPLTFAIDATRTGTAAHKDFKNGTSRNTVETLADIAGGWSGGYAGAVGCAGIGTAILPGVGTIIGGILGGICGGIAGSVGARELSEFVGDKINYDIIEIVCSRCHQNFKTRKYLGEDNKIYCSECSHKIVCQIDSQRISILNCKSNYNNIFDDLTIRWKSIILNSILKMIQNKSAVAHIHYTNNQFQPTEIYNENGYTWKKSQDNDWYCSVVSSNWNECDIESIVSSLEFESSSAWFELKSENSREPDPISFYAYVDRSINRAEEDNSNKYECIGNIKDGNEIVWDNPNWDEAQTFINQLESICTTNRFECVINDKRNKN